MCIPAFCWACFAVIPIWHVPTATVTHVCVSKPFVVVSGVWCIYTTPPAVYHPQVGGAAALYASQFLPKPSLPLLPHSLPLPRGMCVGGAISAVAGGVTAT